MGNDVTKDIPLLILFRILAEESPFPADLNGSMDEIINRIIKELEEHRS